MNITPSTELPGNKVNYLIELKNLKENVAFFSWQ